MGQVWSGNNIIVLKQMSNQQMTGKGCVDLNKMNIIVANKEDGGYGRSLLSMKVFYHRTKSKHLAPLQMRIFVLSSFYHITTISSFQQQYSLVYISSLADVF